MTIQRSGKIYVAPRFNSDAPVPFISFLYKDLKEGSNVFYSSDKNAFLYNALNFTDSIDESDYILLPIPVRSYSGDHKKYISHWASIGRQKNKPVLVFTGGDLQHNIFISDVIVFKGFNYRFLKKDNEVYVPVYAQDLTDGTDVVPRRKSHKPVVGFCGWATTDSMTQRVKMLLKNSYFDVLAVLTGKKYFRAYKKGIFYRNRAIKVCTRSKKIVSNFIIRSTYSAHKSTLSLSVEKAREDFINNILSSDFVLAPKGDGNSSARFYEILSLGRIPILIDTEIILPLEDVIDYSQFILRVPFEDLDRLPEAISKMYTEMEDDEFIAMQLKARQAFETYLRYDSFFNFIFNSGYLQRYHS